MVIVYAVCDHMLTIEMLNNDQIQDSWIWLSLPTSLFKLMLHNMRSYYVCK